MTESYRWAKATVFGAPPMTRDRHKRLPEWLKRHLENLACVIDDLVKDRDGLKENLAAADRKIVAMESESKTKADPVDWSHRPRIPAEGRYEGDLYAQLTVLPGSRKPYTVRVWAWHYSYNQEKWLWRDAYDSVYDDNFPHEKSFRKSWQAVAHLNKVRGRADAKPLTDRIIKAREAGRTLVS